MLLQSQTGEMVLLPALPAAWPVGPIRGICARGGFVVDLQWRAGKLESATVRSRNGGSARVCYGGDVATLSFARGESRHLSPATWRRTASPGVGSTSQSGDS